MEGDRPSKENSPIGSPTQDRTHDVAQEDVIETREVNRASIVDWTPIRMLFAPIARVRGGSPRGFLRGLDAQADPERTMLFAAEDNGADVGQPTESWIVRLLARPFERESILYDMFRGLLMLLAAPFALVAVAIFAAGTAIVGVGKVITGLGHVMTAGQYRSQAREREIAL